MASPHKHAEMHPILFDFLVCRLHGNTMVISLPAMFFSLLSLKKIGKQTFMAGIKPVAEGTWSWGGHTSIKKKLGFVFLRRALPFKVMKNYSCIYWLLKFLLRPQTAVHLSLQT